MDALEKAMNNYFGNTDLTIARQDNTGNFAHPKDTSYVYKEDINSIRDIKENVFSTQTDTLMADGNVDGMEQLCDILKKILNAAWGTDWGEISPDLKKGEDSSNITLPQITAEINNREIADKMPLKPVLINTVKEKVKGQLTGDSILIYRQWFDCVVEFDFYGRTSKEVRDLQFKFEALISVYTGYLKRKGVSEIIFLKETSSRNSLNFTEQTPMKCLMYYVRFERVTPIRQSLINKINADVGIQALNDEKVRLVIEANKTLVNQETPTEIEFDFFNQDTGVDYKDI